MGGGGQYKNSLTSIKTSAFTLAEILITLSIVGIVAALTIPSLIVKNQEKETIVKLKKVYNVFSNAYMLAKIEYGNPSEWGWTNPGSVEGSKNVYDKLSVFLNVVKSCKPREEGCFPNMVYKYYDGRNYTNFDKTQIWTKGVLADGIPFGIYSMSQSCDFVYGLNDAQNTCGSILIDVNGNQPPNQLGRDAFRFYISEKSLIPSGVPDLTSHDGIESCRTVGWSCTAWVLLKEDFNFPPLGQGWD